MWQLLQSAGKIITILSVIFKDLRKLYYEKKYGKLHDTLKEIETKQIDGVLTDDDIIAAAKKLRKQKQGIIP